MAWPTISPVARRERTLADALRAGDTAAPAAVHERYGATLFGSLVNTPGDRATAEEPAHSGRSVLRGAITRRSA